MNRLCHSCKEYHKGISNLCTKCYNKMIMPGDYVSWKHPPGGDKNIGICTRIYINSNNQILLDVHRPSDGTIFEGLEFHLIEPSK